MSRLDKYTEKLDSEVLKRRYDEGKNSAVMRKQLYTGWEVEIEGKVKVVIDGEPVFLQHYYIVFAKEYKKVLVKHGDNPVSRETKIIREKWITRGLKPFFLNKIVLILTGIKVFGEICLFDIGRFDINTFG